MRVFELSPQDEKFRKRVIRGYDALLKKDSLDLLLIGYDYEFEDLVNTSDGQIIVVGGRQGLPLGYAVYFPCTKVKHFADSLQGYVTDELRDCQGQEIKGGSLVSHLRSAGTSIAFIALMQAFKRGEGLGSMMLDYLKAKSECALMTYPLDMQSEVFFRGRGFTDSGLYSGSMPLLVYDLNVLRDAP